jgi:hypothetical protein
LRASTSADHTASRHVPLPAQELSLNLTLTLTLTLAQTLTLTLTLAQERVAEAQVLLAMMCQAGLPVDVVMFNLLMTSYKKKRQWQAAERVMG